MNVSDVNTAGMFDALWKGLAASVVGVFGWAWGISRKHAVLAEQFRLHEVQHASEMKDMKSKLAEIDRGVRRVLDHLTGTKLHGGED
jgi:hypothetical protein